MTSSALECSSLHIITASADGQLLFFFIVTRLFVQRNFSLKILLSKKLRILRPKCALVCRIKSFTVTSGLRISNFRTVCPNKWFLDFGTPCKFQKRASKIFFKGHFSARGTNFGGAIKLSWLVLTHHFVSSPKKNFLNNLKI